MTAFLDRDSGALHFVAARSSDLVQSLQGGKNAQFSFVSKDQSVFASIKGQLGESADRNRLEEIWSPIMSAWFEGGIDDPEVTLMRLTPSEASVWEQTAGALRFAYEIAKANVNDEKKPDVGNHTILNFPIAA